MKLSHLPAILLLVSSCVCSANDGARRDHLGVTCSSTDGGKSCYGYGETYANGTSDACGQIPNGGPRFALKMTYEISGATKCETVIKTSLPGVMPVGQKICSVYLEQAPDGYTYRLQSDPSGAIQKSFNALRSDKWCQSLIDELQ